MMGKMFALSVFVAMCVQCKTDRQTSLSFIAWSLYNVHFKTELLNVHMALNVFIVAATSGPTVVGLNYRTAALGPNLKIGVV